MLKNYCSHECYWPEAVDYINAIQMGLCGHGTYFLSHVAIVVNTYVKSVVLKRIFEAAKVLVWLGLYMDTGQHFSF